MSPWWHSFFAGAAAGTLDAIVVIGIITWFLEWRRAARDAELIRKLKLIRKLNQHPDFNPLAALTPEQRADYDALRKFGYSRDESLAMVMK